VLRAYEENEAHPGECIERRQQTFFDHNPTAGAGKPQITGDHDPKSVSPLRRNGAVSVREILNHCQVRNTLWKGRKEKLNG